MFHIVTAFVFLYCRCTAPLSAAATVAEVDDDGPDQQTTQSFLGS